MTVMVIGAGIAGVACARALTEAGTTVRLVDRAHVPGGRMASKRLGDPPRPVDLGAAYFTAADPEFTRLVHGWRERGLVRPWTDTLRVFDRAGSHDTTGPMRWCTPDGLRSLVTDLAGDLTLEAEHPVHRVGPGPVVDGETFEAVVLAMPDPQAARLLDERSPAAAEVRGAGWEPVIAIAAQFAANRWPGFPGAAFVNEHPDLALIADDGSRRGDGAAVLVAHTTAELARAHDADPAGAVAPALAAVHQLLDFPDRPLWTYAHRWRYARPARAREAAFHLGEDRIGLAGDGWGSPKVETAWRSGTELAAALLAN